MWALEQILKIVFEVMLFFPFSTAARKLSEIPHNSLKCSRVMCIDSLISRILRPTVRLKSLSSSKAVPPKMMNVMTIFDSSVANTL